MSLKLFGRTVIKLCLIRDPYSLENRSKCCDVRNVDNGVNDDNGDNNYNNEM